MLLRKRMLAYILPPMLIILAGLIVFARHHMQNMALDKAYAEAESILLAEASSLLKLPTALTPWLDP